MSDFLSNLIAMSAGAAGAIRPYLPSPFEPAHPTELRLDVDDETAVAATADTPPPAQFKQRATPQHVEPHPPPLTDSRRDEADLDEPQYPARDPAPPAETPAPSASRNASASGDPEPARRGRPLERAAILERGAGPDVERPAEPSHNRAELAPVRTSPGLRSEPPQGAHNHVELAPPVSTLLVVEPQLDSAARDAIVMSGVPSPESPSPPSLAAVVRGHVAAPPPATRTGPRRAGPVTPRALAAPRRSEPDVHVTIGRVEVRATPPPSPPMRRNAPQPMSLDEYLRRRTSGE
ncbi:MAG TPA: hypothetical protein VE713_02180 [Pyrinomonadaceae bacterium]|jgi:hypothetical protein|nr:hypothetical protein [Pyrinomonadaceae bacterium]